MLKTFDETSELIQTGGVFHIAGSEELLKKLPKGSWIGGSTEYFMTDTGGKVTGDMLFVDSFPGFGYKIAMYDAANIHTVSKDAYDSGFSVIILPFDSKVHTAYAQDAANFDDMYLKNIVGWISGLNLNKPSQIPVAVNGQTGEASEKKAVALHLEASRRNVSI